MHKKILLATLALASVVSVARADERLLYYSGFNAESGWTDHPAGTGVVVEQTTYFSNETFTFTLDNVLGDIDASALDDKATGGAMDEMTLGALRAEKNMEGTITISALHSMTRVVFIHAATGNNRGYGLQVSVDGGSSWETVYNTLITSNARAGVKVELDIPATLAGLGKTEGEYGVMLRFYNMNTGQNAYLTDLWIYGEHTLTAEQVTLTTAITPDAAAGTLTVMPPAETYDIDMAVKLTAEAAFGYAFTNWTDATTGSVLSEEATFELTLDANKSVVANFEVLPLCSITVNTSSRNGKYTISPEPAEGGYLPVGTEVTVTAIDTRVATFTGWEDGTTEKVRKFVLANDTEITANFAEEDFIVGWDFDPEPADRMGQVGNYYSAAANMGMFRMYLADGTNRAWLYNEREGKSCVLKWADNPETDNRYFEATFSTEGYENVTVESQMLMGSYSFLKTQVMQYSVDGETYHELARVDYAGSVQWHPLSAALPAECNDCEVVYIRWISEGEHMGSGNDGTGITDIYVFATPVVVYDPVAPSVIATTPAGGSNTASASGSITFTFDKKIKLVEGEYVVMLDGKMLEPRVISNSLIFDYSDLSYATPYTVTVPAGMVANMSDVATTEDIVLNFTTMDRPQPEKQVYDAIVDASLEATIPATDETIGQYKTIWEAVMAAPADRTEPWLIFIKSGYYNDENQDPAVIAEMNQANKEYYYTDAAKGTQETTATSTPGNIVYIYKPFIHLIGQDKESVIIAQDRTAGGDKNNPEKHWYDVSNAATLVVMANDFYAENLTIDNEWWTVNRAAGPQALALYVEGDRVAFNNCNIRSYQDTFLSPKTRNRNAGNTSAAGAAVYHYRDRNFFNECMIEGAVDFIYGGGDVFFESCTINVVRETGGYIVAPSHYDDLTDVTGETGCTRWGYVFKNTLITAPDPAATSVWFGRPWNNNPVTVFIDTECHVTPNDSIWYETMGGIPALWAVYNMWNAEGEALSTESRQVYYVDDVAYSTTKNFLTDEEAAQYTLENVLAGDGTDNPAVGRWNPRPLIEKTSVPACQLNFEDETLHIEWTEDPYAICYVVKVDNKVVGIVTETTFDVTYAMLPSVATLNAEDGKYMVSVQSVNEYGSLSDAFTQEVTWPTSVTTQEREQLSIFAANHNIYLRGISGETLVTVYDLSGRVVNTLTCSRNVTFYMPAGSYVVKAGEKIAKVMVH